MTKEMTSCRDRDDATQALLVEYGERSIRKYALENNRDTTGMTIPLLVDMIRRRIDMSRSVDKVDDRRLAVVASQLMHVNRAAVRP